MYVAFLRGINIGSKNKISMAELKLLFESLELTQVKTLLNSGNVVFESNIYEIKELESKIEIAIKESQLYLYVPTGYGKTKLTNTFIEKKSSSLGTTRNLNTILKLEAWMTQKESS